MYLLGIDLETTGLNFESSEIIEIGYVVWDIDSSSSVEQGNFLIKINSPVPTEIVALTGITDKYLKDFGGDLKSALEKLVNLAEKCDYLVGHNAISFDRIFLKRDFQKFNLKCPEKFWIDTMIDLPYPANIRTRKLDYLAAEHRVLVLDSHRAISDVIKTLKILEKYPCKEVCERAETGMLKLIANVSYDERKLASNEGFKWDSENKIWFKIIRAYDAKDLKYDFSMQSENITEVGSKGCS